MHSFADKARRVERIRQILRHRYGAAPAVTVTHPVEHALRAILAEEAAAKEADEGLERLRRHFVDLNDLRVSRPREIRDVLGQNFPRSAHKARVMPRMLDQVFKRHNTMIWDFLEDMGKVQARAYFEKLEDVRPFVAATLVRDCLGAHAFPVDTDIIRVLGRLGIVDPAKESEPKVQAFLERAVKADRAYEMHWLLKRLAEDVCIVGTPLCPKCSLNKMCSSAVFPSEGKGRKGKAGVKAAAKAVVKAVVKKEAKPKASAPKKSAPKVPAPKASAPKPAAPKKKKAKAHARKKGR
jgi:endonuclease III